MALRTRGDYFGSATRASTPPRSCRTSRLRLATSPAMPVQRNKAIVGHNAFAHEAGIHQDGMLKDAATYEIMRPEDLGLTDRPALGKHCGRHAFARACKAGHPVAAGGARRGVRALQAAGRRRGRHVTLHDVVGRWRREAETPVVKVACLAGDGVGPELMAEASRALAAVAHQHGFELQGVHVPYGGEAFLRSGQFLSALDAHRVPGRRRVSSARLGSGPRRRRVGARPARAS